MLLYYANSERRFQMKIKSLPFLLLLVIVTTSSIAKNHRQIAYTEQNSNGLKVITVTESRKGAFLTIQKIGLEKGRDVIPISINDFEILYNSAKRLNLKSFLANDTMDALNNYLIAISPKVGKVAPKLYEVPHEEASDKVREWIASLKSFVENSFGNKIIFNSTSRTISIQVISGFKAAVYQDDNADDYFKECILSTELMFLAPPIETYLQKSITSKNLKKMNMFSKSLLGQKYLNFNLVDFEQQHNVKSQKPIEFSKTEKNKLNSFLESSIGKEYLKLLKNPNPELEAIVNKKLGQLMQRCQQKKSKK